MSDESMDWFFEPVVLPGEGLTVLALIWFFGVYIFLLYRLTR